MPGGAGGLTVLLLSFAVLDLTLGTTVKDITVPASLTLPVCLTPTETMTLLPHTSSSTAAILRPSSPATSTPEMPVDAFPASAAAPQGSSPAAPSITTAQERGSTAHSSTGSPQLELTTGMPTGMGLTTGTPTSASMAKTPNCPQAANVTSAGTSTALALSSFGVEMSTLPPPTSTVLSSTWVGTTLGTSTHQGPTTTALLGSTSPGSGSASPTIPALTDTSNKPLMTPSDTTASVITSTVATKSTPAPSQPVGTTARTTLGTSTLIAPEDPSATAETTAMGVTATTSPSPPTSSISMETSAQLPTTDSTTADTLSPSSPETEASTPERSSTSPGTGSTPTPTTPPPTTTTATSSQPLTSLANTTASPVISTEVPLSTPSPSHPARTTSRTTPDIFPPTMESTPGIEFSFPTMNSIQTSEVTSSTPADLPMPPPVCPTGSSNTSASHLFLSLRLSTPLDLGNSTVQELVLTKLREDLQTAFPCAGLSLEWRGKRIP